MSNSTRASARGSGRIFKPHNSVNWHCAYYRYGKEIRESTGIPCLDPDRKDMVRPERFELPTFWFVARRSIQLS